MKKLKNALLFAVIGFIISLPVHSKAGQVQDVIDHFLAAASTQLPDPGMASLLSAAPSVIKSSQMKKCEVNMQNIVLELDTHPPADRVAELEDALDRNQAIFNALNGNPESLERYTEFKKKREKERRLKQQKEERAEQEDNLKWQFRHYRTKIEELKEKIDRINSEKRGNLAGIGANLSYLPKAKYGIQQHEAITRASVDRGNQLCTEIKKQLKKIAALRDEIQGGESLVQGRIASAREKAKACESAADVAAVKQAYASAKAGLSIMKQAMDGIEEAWVELAILNKQLEKINENLMAKHDGSAWAVERDEYQLRLDQTKTMIAWLNKLPAEIRDLDSDRKKLKQELGDARKHYEPLFPQSKREFNNLEFDLNALSLPEPVYPQYIYELEGKLIEAEKTGFVTRGQRPDIYSGPPPVVRCHVKDTSLDDYKAADDSFLRALTEVRANEGLAGGCQRKEPKVQQPDTPDAGPDKVADKTEDNNNSGAEADAQKEIYGGLRIAGPTTIYVDKRTAFTAVDAAGRPYPSDDGGFVWKTTMESLMTISRSGNPAGASAFKPGICMILVKYKGMTAWLDVTIKPAQDDSGGEESLFSMEGGETVEDFGDTDPPFSIEEDETVENSGGADSLFSMEGGETVAEIKTDDSGQDISLLGVELGMEQEEQAQAVAQENTSTTANTFEGAAPKLNLKFDDIAPMGSRRNTIVVWRVYQSHWMPHVIIENMAPETILNKKLYLKADINGKDYYFYNYSVLNKAFESSIPYRSIGRTRIKITCPGHPKLGEINIDSNFTSEDFSRGLNESKKFISPQSGNELARRKQAYESALTAPEKKLGDIDESAGKYAELLVQQALSLCNLGRYDEAYQSFGMALEPLARRIDVQYSWEKKPNNQLEVKALAYALMSRANMQLMVFTNKSEYMKIARDALNLLLKYGNQYDLKDEILFHSMHIAENLLTAGCTREEVKPFYDLGIRYMPAEKQERHKKNWEQWNNCYAVFVKGLPTADRR